MRVAIRADATPEQGAGHVMRMLALTEGLVARGHHTTLLTHVEGIPWLAEYLKHSKIDVKKVEQDTLPLDDLHSLNPHLVVYDGYRFSPTDTNRLMGSFPCTLAVIDGSSLDYSAHFYLDQNLGASGLNLLLPEGARMMFGHRFALIRHQILQARRLQTVRRLRKPSSRKAPRLLVLAGGTDPTGATPHIAASLNKCREPFTASVIVSNESFKQLNVKALQSERVTFVSTNTNLHAHMAEADLAISAAGTSAWDLLTVGIPTAFFTVAENQVSNYHEILSARLGYPLGMTAGALPSLGELTLKIDDFLANRKLQPELRRNALGCFDGKGTERVLRVLAGCTDLGSLS